MPRGRRRATRASAPRAGARVTLLGRHARKLEAVRALGVDVALADAPEAAAPVKVPLVVEAPTPTA